MDSQPMMDPNEFIPMYQIETGRVITGLIADLAAKDLAIQQLQEQIRMYEQKLMENTE